MNELLGPRLLSPHGTEISTADALQGKELILLYFSASWCTPCKTFSPILMKFYPICQQNNVEIIFISSDRTQSSFWEYYKTMPWLAMSLDSYSAPYSKGLSTKLSIRTIPQVVVLDCKGGNGDYITNDAKSQIVSAWNKVRDRRDNCDDYDQDDAFLDLIRSWKDAPTIPVGQVKLGVVSSMLTKVQNVLGYSPFPFPNNNSNDTTNDKKIMEKNIQDLKIQSEQNDRMEAQEHLVNVLTEFLQEATVRLKVYPSNTQQRMKLMQPISGNEQYVVPVSLEEHRRLLLQEQLEALEDTIIRVKERKLTHVMNTSAEIVQEHLRSLGMKDFSKITSDTKIQQDLLMNMSEMNHHARNAFVRSVLWSEMQWIKTREMDHARLQMVVNFETDRRESLKRSNDGIPMDRKTVLEFCGLCNTAIRMEEVERYLKFGHEILDRIDNEEQEHDVARSQNLSVHQRIILLQQLMLCAVGFEPNFGGQELHRIMSSDLSNDDELNNVIASYFINMQLFAKSVGEDEGITEGLSDMKHGGVTKVVSVKYSEKFVDQDPSAGAYDAPNPATMEHNSDEKQWQELKLAAKAASMQKEILDELLDLDDAEREIRLQQARESHELFVQQCMSLAPGPERVAFLQNIQPEQQKILLIHKLWEARAKN
mmetsp:Transcript_197/g.296  ORF Transcript_197/g.296 Transcript_197/m.296 type:complete len:651 (-) Transcript_197:45-1997(-)